MSHGLLAIAVLLLCIIISQNIYAAENREVRVAFFPMDGYHIINDDGDYDGMDVEYLKNLSEYANWDIRYVKCNSWEEALQMLSEKQVDLVGSAQYSKEREELYAYADLASGYTFGVIATNPEKDIAYEDFAKMKSYTFGMVKNYVRRNEFLEYLANNNIQNPVIVEYDTTADLQTALSSGEVDAMVHTFTEVREGQRLIGRFAPRPFYYITYKGNDDVLQELNQGIVDLKMNKPELENELMQEFYYNRFDKSVLLSTVEKQYIADKGKFVVGYLDDYYPFSYEEDGVYSGLSRELIESGLGVTGVDIEYKKMASNQEANAAVASGEIDFFVYSTDNSDVLQEYNLKRVCEYAEVPLVLVMRNNQKVGEINSIATVSFLKDAVMNNVASHKENVISFETQQECIDVVTEGLADAVVCNGYIAEHLMRTDMKYSNLQIKKVLSENYKIAIAVNREDEHLANILNKTISTIDYRMINEFMLRENSYPLMSVTNFIENNSLVIVGALLILIILIVTVVGHMLMDSKKIQRLMYKDTKMDIWNMNYLIYYAEHKLLPERKQRYVVVNVNLSQFRHYNVIYGWDAGEELLGMLGQLLGQAVDEKLEICAREQGDRFVLLLRYQESDKLIQRLKTLKEEVEERIWKDTENHMTLRMGVYFIPENTTNMKEAISNSSQALEFMTDKTDIQLYDEAIQALIKERHEREKLLESVDIQKDFVAFYQPKVDIRTGKIVGGEALVRFLDPSDGGKIKAPGFFVPYYEQTGRITDIDFFVFEESCKLLRKRLDAGLPVVKISCNFSRMHFIKEGFVELFEAILDKHNISKDLIELEITETLVVEELQHNMVKRNIDILREHGIHLSIDDFGAGYSSLGIFEQIPASVVKLDRSFFLNQEDRTRQVKIMRGIVNLTQELDAQIVCEGVETENDVALMHEIGAYVAQGYFYSRPVPENEFESMLDAS